MHAHQIFGKDRFNAFDVLFAQVHCIQILYTSQLTLNHKLINFQVYLQFYNVLYLISSLKFRNYIKNVITLKAKYTGLNRLYKLWSFTSSMPRYITYCSVRVIINLNHTPDNRNYYDEKTWFSNILLVPFSAKGNWLWHSVFVEFEWLLTNDDK